MRVKLLILISFFFLTNFAIGQAKVSFKVTVSDKATGKNEGGVSVKLYEGSNLVKSYTTDATGVLRLDLEGKKKYKLEFSKAGKVMRFVSIDLKNVEDELIQGANAPKGELDMSLFEALPNVDYSYVTTNPATEYFFDPTISQNLEYDQILADKMRKKVEKILKDAEGAQKQGEANYNSIVKQADALFTAKKYEEALTQYEAAVKIKPTEKHPNDRLIEIDGILKAAKSANLANSQLDSEYKALITSADGLRDQKKYPEAIARYNEALAKKQEQYPKDEIQKCELAIETAKKDAENGAKYDAAMKAADGFYGQKSWMAARDKYKEALKIRPGDAAATAKLADLDGKLNAQKSEQEKKQKYNDAVAAGDAFMGEEKWTEAITKYNEALTFEPSSTYVKDKIAAAKVKLDEIAKANALKEQITKLLAEGNTALTAKQYPGAKAKFEQVLTLDKENGEAKAKIEDINKQLEFEKANAEKIAKAKQLVTEGDALDKATKYADAKAKYQESIALIPDAAVQAKIDAVDAKILADSKKAEQKAKFDQAILDGDAALATSDFDNAKKKYEEAQLLDAASQVPKQKLIELAKKETAANAEKDKNQKYQEAFNAGMAALGSKDYTTAKEKFLAATTLDNTKKEAKDKLDEVNKILADNAQAAAQKDKYEAAVKAGTDLLGQNKLAEAKKKFEEASTLDPSQTLPKEKIQEIDALITKADKEKQITQLLADGSAALSKKDLNGAKGKFQQVLTLDPANNVASEKMTEILKLESDQLGEAQKQAAFDKLKGEGMSFQNQNKYAEAKQKYLEAKAIKSDEEVEKAIVWCDKKIAEELKDAELNKKYNAILAEAKELETAKKYDEAIVKYNEALAVKNEQEPKNRIAAINALKSQNAEQQKVEQDYLAAIQKGDDLVAAKKYPEAIQSYNAALVLKPYEKLPVEKAENAKKLSEQETADGVDQAYQKIIDVGNKSFDEKNYVKAKEMFNRAVNFRPADAYPKQKLQQIEELEKTEKLAVEQQTQYTKKMAEADGLAKANKIPEAISTYKAAKAIKPDELTPDQKIAELEALLANKVDPAVEEQKLYDAAMQRGNTAALGKDYNGAITQYEEALRHKAKDQTAQNKISEMRQILEDIAKENAANKELQGLIAAADQEFNDGKWSNAKSAYDNILSKYPSNAYAYEQGKKCEIKLKESDQAEKDRIYRNIISGADDKFDNKNYAKAKELYERAVTQKPSDPYPKQRLREIQNITSQPIASTKVEVKSNTLELKELGEATDNSLVDGAARLQKTKEIRKGKRSSKMIEKLRGTTDKSNELSKKQNDQALSVDSIFGEIRIDNAIRNEAASAKVQNNIDAMDEKANALIKNKEELATINQLNTVNQKEQLEAATQAVIVSNSALDGAAVDNNEVIKKSNNNLTNTKVEMGNEKYSEIVKNDAAYADIRLTLEKNGIDDFEERLAEEKKVKEASIVQTDLMSKNSEKAATRTVETKEVLKDVENNISMKTTEDMKLSVNNDEKMKEIEKVQTQFRVNNDQAHVENTQRFADKNNETSKVVAEAVASRIEVHRGNVEIVENKRDQKTEIDRADYNKAYVKNIENKKILNEKVVEVEKRAELPSISGVENVKNFTEIQNASTQSQMNQQKLNDEKIVENKSKIINVQAQIKNESGQNSHSTENDQMIKNSVKELGTTAQIQSEKSDERTVSAKKSIDEIQSTQPVKTTSGAYEVDLTKYKEGVNQEQFDQMGSDGLVSAIVTRRVVVIDGKANVYLRTQTMNIVTYSKNGQACTELVWQKETQDAKLKRNY